MKKANILILCIVATLLGAVLAVFAVVLESFGVFEEPYEAADRAMRHYIAICVNPQFDGWEDIKNGLKNAAAERNAAIEFLETGFEDERAEASCIEMAVDSGADGIILYTGGENIDRELNYAAEQFVPVVLVVNNYDHDKIFQIESNPTLFAAKMVTYVEHLNISNKRIALISSEQSEAYKSGQFHAQFKKKHYTLNIKTFSGAHVFDAYETVKDLIASKNETELICCLDATATLGVAQSIVELNKVNVTTIVGCGKTEEILNMIEKGIVSATLAIDYEKIGRDAVEILSENATKPFAYKKHISSEIFVIDGTNVADFREENAE